MPLKLSLKPGETFIVNGAVVRNGERRGILLLENQARILREKDIMQPEDANTPTGRAYFAIMQMYLLGDSEGAGYDQACEALADLAPTDADLAMALSREVASGNLYKALSRCRKALAAEGRNSAPAREVSHG
ncbi:MAG: flagellar biosynthesis repressor FlbT [Pseudomonadota bacterium]